MKRKITLVLLLFVVVLTLSASRGYVHQLPKDSLVSDILEQKEVLKDTTIVHTTHTTSTPLTASTLLDEYGNAVDTSVVKLPNTYAWRIDTRFGDRILTPMDTLRENFHRSRLVEGKGIAMSYLGNIGSATESKDFFERKDVSQFPFMDPYEIWRRNPENHLFLNTKIPYSNVYYQAGGGKQVAENHFRAELSSNFGKRLNIGFNFDYIYARGHYDALYNKQISYDFNASYIGEKYKMHVFLGNNNLQLSQNGGIMDDRYITNPDLEDLQNTRGNSLDIPVMFEEGIRNKYRGRHIYMTNSYDLGKDKEYIIEEGDSIGEWQKKANYIAPASVILTTNYQDQRRRIFSPASITSDLHQDVVRFDSVYVANWAFEDGTTTAYDDLLDDYMSHYTFKNTLAFRMNEGFKDWTKFGLTAFVEYDMRRYLLLSKDGAKNVNEKHSDDVYYVGGKLNKNQGKYFKFEASALKGINNSALELEVNAYTQFNLFGKEIAAKANVYFKNQVPGFFQQNFRSRNLIIEKNFNDTKRIYVGGEITFPKLSFLETKGSGGYENITDYIYVADVKIGEYQKWQRQDNFRRDYLQASKSINVISLKLDQKYTAGIFHFDLQALVQKTSNEAVIPLPLWTAYGNAYIETILSQVLTVQLGVDAYIHDRYYAPAYDVLLGQFYSQRTEGQGRVKIGKFPFANAYVNFHLKYTRFFVMVYNVGETLGNRDSFTTPHYPVNPFKIQFGLSWKFNN